MRVKKFLTFMLALAFTGAIGGGFSACMQPSDTSSVPQSSEEPASSSEESSSEESSSNPSRDPVTDAKKLDSVPQSNAQVKATANAEATANWFVSYEGNALRATVYVEDNNVYKKSASLFDNDSVEIIASITEAVDGYSNFTVSVTVDANGSVYVKRPKTDETVENSGVTARVKDFTVSGEAVEGWYAIIDIPYSVFSEYADATKDKAVCLGLSNVDSVMARDTQYWAGFDTKPASVRTYAWVSDDDTFERNPYYFDSVDGINIDGKRDDAYGAFTDTVTLDEDRWYTVSAVKTASGVLIYSQALFNTSTTVAVGGWGNATNFEFILNGEYINADTKEGSYVNLAQEKSTTVDRFVMTAEQQANGKYLHTVELFVPKASVKNFASGDVQLNYAWKSPNERAAILDDIIALKYIMAWDPDGGWENWSDWHSYHRLGGIAVAFNDLVDNLHVSANGLVVEEAPAANGITIDGEVKSGEPYGAAELTVVGEGKVLTNVKGTVINGDLYLAFTITHGAWSTPWFNGGEWWRNDNVSFNLGGADFAVQFLEGKLCLPADVTQGAAKTVSVGANQVTTLEVYIDGASNATYNNLKLNENGDSFGWNDVMWGNTATVTSAGIVENTVTVGGVVLDAKLTDSVYTSTVKANKFTDTANGATIEVIARKVSEGVVVGATVVHTKPISEKLVAEGKWSDYLGVELVLNGTHGIMTATRGFWNTQGYSKTVKNNDGTYTTTFEIFVANETINATATTTEVTLAIGGFYDGGFVWFNGADPDNKVYTQKVTENGIVANA